MAVPSSKVFHLRMQGHCLLCLRKTTEENLDSLRTTTTAASDCEKFVIVPKAVETPSLLSTFNLVWPYLQKKKEISPHQDSNDEVDISEVMTGVKKSTKSAGIPPPLTFACLPALCQFCGEGVQQVEYLMKAVRSQVEILRKIIAQSKRNGRFSWRMDTFERNVRQSEMDPGDVEFIVQFVNDLGDAIPEEKNTVVRQEILSGPKILLRNPTHSRLVEGPPVEKCANATDEDGRSFKKVKRDPLEMSDSESIKEENDYDYTSDREAEVTSNMEWEEAECSEKSDMDIPDDDPDYIKSEIEDDGSSEGDDSEGTSEEEEHKNITITKKAAKGKIDFKVEIFRTAKEPPPPPKKAKPTKKFKSMSKYTSTVYPCPAPGCSRYYHQISNVSRHLRMCHQSQFESLYKTMMTLSQDCDMCGTRLPSSEIFQHVQDHVGEYALRCPNSPCPFAFTNATAISAHERSLCQYRSSKDISFSCETCPFTTTNLQMIRSHVDMTHERSLTKNFPCPIKNCDKSFCVRQSVSFHLRTHNLRQMQIMKCDICFQMVSISTLPQHFQERHQVSDILSCQHCPCVFSTRVALIKHFYAHRLQGISCDLCHNTVKYFRHKDLVDHYTSAHQLDLKQFVCDVCAAKFFSDASLKKHKDVYCSKNVEKSSKKKLKQFPCDLCVDPPVSFSSEALLVTHKIKVHGEDPFVCATCQKTFTSHIGLQHHEKEHAGVETLASQKKTFKCDQPDCGKAYTTKRQLKVHQDSVHVEGGKRFACDQCDKRYAEVTRLKRHVDTVHLGLRPFVCETCGEGFATGHSLQSHVLIHTGERPFACDLCGQRFRHKEVMKRHVESHEKKGDAFKPSGPMKNIRKRKDFNK